MHRNPGYILTEISGTPYILPFGQMIADHYRGISVNETGALIWKLLEHEATADEVIQKCAAHYQIPREELARLSADIHSFLNTLAAMGILEDSTTDFLSKISLPSRVYRIAGLKIRLVGTPDSFPEPFLPFEDPILRDIPIPEAECDQTVYILPGIPSRRQNGTILIRDEALMLMELEDSFLFLFPNFPGIQEALLSKDGKRATFSCTPPFDDAFRENLFHAIRHMFLYVAQKHNMVVLHSASILYRDKLWLFSGHSGMGKSTHTNLWQRLFHAPVINGDLNLLAMENGKPICRGIPWCGTSGKFDTLEYELGGIILLNQYKTDEITTLPPREQRLLVTQRLISPAWSPEMLRGNLALIDQMASQLMICKLKCTKEESAAVTMKAYIDRQYL